MGASDIGLLLSSLAKRVNYSGLDLSVDIDSVFHSHEVVCSQAGKVVWVAEIDDGSVREIYSSPRYTSVPLYDYDTMLDLFTLLVSRLHSFVKGQIGFSGFLSLLLGSHVVSWKSYCARILAGTGLPVERGGRKLVVDGVSLSLAYPYLYVDGSYSYRVEVNGESSLFASLGAILSGILVMNDTDISLQASAKASLVGDLEEDGEDGFGGDGGGEDDGFGGPDDFGF